MEGNREGEKGRDRAITKTMSEGIEDLIREKIGGKENGN